MSKRAESIRKKFMGKQKKNQAMSEMAPAELTEEQKAIMERELAIAKDEYERTKSTVVTQEPVVPVPHTVNPLADSDMRYRDSVPLQLFRSLKIGIAGLGAVGRQVALLLATMGHKGLVGVDPDVVEAVNVGTQGWMPYEIGGMKALQMEHSIAHTNGWAYMEGIAGRFESIVPPVISDMSIIFCCVDSMSARKNIWSYVMRTWGNEEERTPRLFVDARVAARTVRILTVPTMDQTFISRYENTMYSDAEAYEGPCTDRMNVYTACIAAGLMVSQMVNWLNNQNQQTQSAGALKRPIIPDFLLETTMMLVDTNGVVDVTPQPGEAENPFGWPKPESDVEPPMGRFEAPSGTEE